MKEIILKEINKKSFHIEWGLFLLFLIGTLIHFHLADFSKCLTTYVDEQRYYTIAKSIFNDGEIAIRGISKDFQKIAYALVLTPFFYIQNVRTRIRCIALLNSCLMMSSIFPAWLIAKELDLNKRVRYLIVGIISIWPDLMLSATFMAETLYWPVFVTSVYFWLKAQKTGKIKYIVGNGIITYIGYLTKEIFLAVFLAYIFSEFIFPVLDHAAEFKQTGRNLRRNAASAYNRKNFSNLFLYVIVFVSCHIALKATLFRGMGNSYDQQGIEAILSAYNFMYMLYAFIYYLVSVLVAYFIVPIIMPILFFDKLREDAKKLYTFAILFLGTASATIAYTISVREDLGRVAPRLHFRYFGPIVVIILCVCAKTLFELKKEDLFRRRKKIFLSFIFSTAAILVYFRGTTIGCPVDQYVVGAYQAFVERIGDLLPPDGMKKVFYLGAMIANAAIFIWAMLCYKALYKSRKILGIFLVTTVSAASLANDYSAYQLIYPQYHLEEGAVEEAEKINDFVKTIDADKNVVYFVDSDSINLPSRVLDTYLDRTKNLYYVDGDTLTDIPCGETATVSDLTLRENIWETAYDSVSSIDYIIVESTFLNKGFDISNMSEITEIAGNYFDVFENQNPEFIGREVDKDLILQDDLEINFTGDEYNALCYVANGISGKEDGFSWTDGDVVQVRIPCSKHEGEATVQIEIVGTFNGEKSYSISNNGFEYTSGTINGSGAIKFTAEISNGELSFDMNCLDAEQISQVFVESTDQRKVAFQIRKIAVNIN